MRMNAAAAANQQRAMPFYHVTLRDFHCKFNLFNTSNNIQNKNTKELSV